MKDGFFSEVKEIVSLFTGQDREKKKKRKKKRNQCIVSHIEGKDSGSENEVEYKKTSNMLHCLTEWIEYTNRPVAEKMNNQNFLKEKTVKASAWDVRISYVFVRTASLTIGKLKNKAEEEKKTEPQSATKKIEIWDTVVRFSNMYYFENVHWNSFGLS